MTLPSQHIANTCMDLQPPSSRTRSAEHGVVLIIALILLVVISLLAVTSLRNAGSSESVAANVRTTEMATQAADIALRYCESQVLATPTVAGFTILPMTTPPQWQNLSAWDTATTSSTVTFALPASDLNESGLSTTYKRSPECMVECLKADCMHPSGIPNTTATFVVTARGFGPEVPALTGTTRIRPIGSEVWLQSHIELE